MMRDYIVFIRGEMQMMCDYMVFIRGEMHEDGAAATSEFFRTPDGNKVGNFSKELNRLQVAYGIILKRRKGDQRASLRVMFAKPWNPPARYTSRAIQSV